ncbi:MAG: hypothetical protein CMK59_13705 [Proteobacteria bacterium]|nr:hypothetical protein [Pseudomonadota bacterium]
MTQLNKTDLVEFLTEGFAVTFQSEQQRQALFELIINMVNDDQENYWAAPRHPKGKIRLKKNQPLQILIDVGNAPILLVSITQTNVEILLPEEQKVENWKQHVAKIAFLLLTTLNLWSHLQNTVNNSSAQEDQAQKFELQAVLDIHSQPSTKSNPARKLSSKHTRKKSLLNKKLALLIK